MGSIASPDNNAIAESLDRAAAALSAQAKALRSGSAPTSQAAHTKLVDTVKDALALVQDAQDDVIDMMLAFVRCTSLRLMLKYKIFETIPTSGTITYQELADKVGTDVPLLTRLCWALIAPGILRQEGTDRVGHTARSIPYASVNSLSCMIQAGFDEYIPPLIAMPAYFEKYGFKQPTGRTHSAKAYQEGKPEYTFIQLMTALPMERMKTMILALTAMDNMYFTPVPFDWSWVASQADVDPKRPLLVDVGGGKGEELIKITKTTPGLPLDRCVYEELPMMIERMKMVGGTDLQQSQMIGMDFFEGQPVKGALVYLLRLILRDYSDEEGVTILKHIVDVMEPDSKLIISEPVLDNPPSAMATMVDVLLATIGGQERTLATFTAIANKAGLKVVEVARSESTEMSIIVCQKA